MSWITVLGATGSIGQQSLAVIAELKQQYQIYALTANDNVDDLFSQCQQYQPKYAVLVDENAAEKLRVKCRSAGLTTEILAGRAALQTVSSAECVSHVIVGIVGFAALAPTMAAVESDKVILLANKEVFVAAGEIFTLALTKSNARVFPLDSEHHALFECLSTAIPLSQAKLDSIEHVTLTASGGPCLHIPLNQLQHVTPAQACKHPTWNMGQKISVDSATLCNKAFEVIEAHYLFQLPYTKIQVAIHPQSIVHALVSFVDGSIQCHLANPDMRLSISRGLCWPNHHRLPLARLSHAQLSSMTFSTVDLNRYPCFDFIIRYIQAHPTAGVIINAANEIAVAAFIANKICFTDIVSVIRSTCESLNLTHAKTLADINQYNDLARQQATELMESERFCHRECV